MESGQYPEDRISREKDLERKIKAQRAFIIIARYRQGSHKPLSNKVGRNEF